MVALEKTVKMAKKRRKLHIFSAWRHVTEESLFFTALSLPLCLLHSSVSNGKQSVDVVLGNMSRTRHKGKKEGER